MLINTTWLDLIWLISALHSTAAILFANTKTRLFVGVSAEPSLGGWRHSTKLELTVELFHAGDTMCRRFCTLHTWVPAAQPWRPGRPIVIDCRQPVKVKGKGKTSGTWYSAAPRWTHAQECFTVSEVAANWHELMIPQPRDGTGSLGHGSPGQRFWPGRVGSRVSMSNPMFDPILSWKL